MTLALGTVPAGTTLYIPFATYAGSTGASATLTGLAVTDIEIYKNGSTTQRSSDAGYSLLDTDGIDFDGVTGIHGFSIDLSDNTDAGFYAVGSWYWVVVSAVTVDSQTVNFIAAVFRIGPAESVAGYPKADVSHFGGAAGTFASGIPEVKVASIAANAITATSIASDAITAAKIADGAIDAATFAAGAITATVIADGAIDAATFAAGAIDASAIAANAIGASELATDAVTEIVDAVWAAAARTLTAIDEDSTTLDLDATIRGALGMASANLDTQIGTLATAANLSTVSSMLTAVKNVSDKHDTMLEEASGSPGDWEYRADALRNAPTGSGGGGGGASAEDVATAVWAHAARTLTALDEDSTTIDIDAAVRNAIGLSSANILDYLTVMAKLDTMLQAAGGSPGDWEYRGDALRHAPTGSGGGGASAGDIATAVWGNATRTLTAIDEDSTTLDLDATIRSAVGMASADLDTQLDALPAIKAVTDKVDTMLEVAAGSPTDYRLSEDAVRKVASVVPTAEQNADTLLDRDMSAGADNGSPSRRTPRQALRILRNKWSISGNTQTITKEDDSTTSWTQTLTGTAGADPVTGTDPA